MGIQRVRDRKNTQTFSTFQAVFLGKRKKRGGKKLIKIQLSLTFSLLPFQSFYSFKSLTISMKLKCSSRHLWNGDTFDNNAFEEPVTFSPQTSLINAQTVFLFSLLLFSRFLSNWLVFLCSLVPQFEFKKKKKKRWWMSFPWTPRPS